MSVSFPEIVLGAYRSGLALDLDFMYVKKESVDSIDMIQSTSR